MIEPNELVDTNLNYRNGQLCDAFAFRMTSIEFQIEQFAPFAANHQSKCGQNNLKPNSNLPFKRPPIQLAFNSTKHFQRHQMHIIALKSFHICSIRSVVK